MDSLFGQLVVLRPAATNDVESLVRIRATPEVLTRWRGTDLDAEIREAIDDDELHLLTIEDHDGNIVGAIQWAPSDDPDYPHASVDLFIDPAVHGRGLGTDAVRTLCIHLTTTLGFHRLVIDPAADNAAAIRCYTNVGFRPVGVMRSYERDADGSLHDGLLMDLLANEIIDP
jgi:aminoglycoside 6'-N-acetyltransferase